MGCLLLKKFCMEQLTWAEKHGTDSKTRKNVQRVPTVEYSWGMSLFSLASSNWFLGQKKQLLFLKYGSLTKRTSKTWDISRRCPQPAGKLSWFEKLARSHGWAARERGACSLRVLSQLVLLARNGELARRLPGKKMRANLRGKRHPSTIHFRSTLVF